MIGASRQWLEAAQALQINHHILAPPRCGSAAIANADDKGDDLRSEMAREAAFDSIAVLARDAVERPAVNLHELKIKAMFVLEYLDPAGRDIGCDLMHSLLGDLIDLAAHHRDSAMLTNSSRLRMTCAVE